jgi:hypothetical protein
MWQSTFLDSRAHTEWPRPRKMAEEFLMPTITQPREVGHEN